LISQTQGTVLLGVGAVGLGGGYGTGTPFSFRGG